MSRSRVPGQFQIEQGGVYGREIGPDMKHYDDRVPACGVFCGGCPAYAKDKKPCPGAGINSARCDSCTTFHLCCKEKGITHCYQCAEFPCKRFRDFSKRWLKYGQNFIENQKLIKAVGEAEFLRIFNEKAK